MTTIRAECPQCGEVRLTTDDLTVRVCADDDSASYSFRCPCCDGPVTKPAGAHIVDVLVSSGVRRETWRRPAEMLERKSGPPVTLDDLLDFHVLLQQDDWQERLHGTTPGSSTGWEPMPSG